MVQMERIIDEGTPENITSSEDDTSKKQKLQRTSNMLTSTIQCSSFESVLRPTRDEYTFFEEGTEKLKKFFENHFPDGRDKRMESRVFAVYNKAFQMQRDEKNGNIPFNGTSEERQRYSQNTLIIIAALWVAHIESPPPRNQWSISYLCDYFAKPQISVDVIKRLLSRIGIHVRNLAQSAKDNARKRNVAIKSRKMRQEQRWKPRTKTNVQ